MNRLEIIDVVASSLRAALRNHVGIEVFSSSLNDPTEVPGKAAFAVQHGDSRYRLRRSSTTDTVLRELESRKGLFTMGPSYRPDEVDSENHLIEFHYVEAVMQGDIRYAEAKAEAVAFATLASVARALPHERRVALEALLEKGLFSNHQSGREMYSRFGGTKPAYHQQVEIARETIVFVDKPPVGYHSGYWDVATTGDGTYDAFEVIFPLSGVTISGGEFERDPNKLQAALEASEVGRNSALNEALLRALETHTDLLASFSSPISFIGFGFERLCQFALVLRTISEAAPLLAGVHARKATHDKATPPQRGCDQLIVMHDK